MWLGKPGFGLTGSAVCVSWLKPIRRTTSFVVFKKNCGRTWVLPRQSDSRRSVIYGTRDVLRRSGELSSVRPARMLTGMAIAIFAGGGTCPVIHHSDKCKF